MLDDYDILTVQLWSEINLSPNHEIFYFGKSSPSTSSARCYWDVVSSTFETAICCSVNSTTEFDHMCTSLGVTDGLIHVAVIFNPVVAEMKLFVNGSLSKTTTLGSGIPGRSASDSLYFTEHVREFQIWAGLLGDSELYQHFNRGPGIDRGKFYCP